MMSFNNSGGGSGVEPEEDECRVCRSNDERELYSPCRCSGSVGTYFNFIFLFII